MNVRKTSKPNPVPVSISILISVAGFLVSLFCAWYYLRFIQGSVTGRPGQQVFYLILILFVISAGAVIFGVINSIRTLRGEYEKEGL